MAQPIRQINPDGTALMEDGTEVQLVVGRGGAVGVRRATTDDHISGIDQVGGPTETFDTSGLDQG